VLKPRAVPEPGPAGRAARLLSRVVAAGGHTRRHGGDGGMHPRRDDRLVSALASAVDEDRLLVPVRTLAQEVDGAVARQEDAEEVALLAIVGSLLRVVAEFLGALLLIELGRFVDREIVRDDIHRAPAAARP